MDDETASNLDMLDNEIDRFIFTLGLRDVDAEVLANRIARYMRIEITKAEIYKNISEDNCGTCADCIEERDDARHNVGDFSLHGNFMIVCETCGNKRCPHATNHNLACTGSNESGQPGSNYKKHVPRDPNAPKLTTEEFWALISPHFEDPE